MISLKKKKYHFSATLENGLEKSKVGPLAAVCISRDKDGTRQGQERQKEMHGS